MSDTPRRIPLWLKVAYTAFVAILVPVYLKNYGPTNFLYFCDIALLMTVYAIWRENAVLLSAALVGIFLPQMLWVVDFFCVLFGGKLTGMTNYMFEPPFFLRFLSFFHFWLPFLLLYLVWRVGYDRRGVIVWTIITWVVLTICYVWMPPASPTKDPVTGVPLRDPNIPVNIDYVYNIVTDEEPQTWMDPDVYLAVYMLALVIGIFLPTHFLFQWLLPAVPRSEPEA